jgi:integrase
LLTDTAIRKAKPGIRGYKLADTHGLHVFVSPAGGKSWRFRYEFAGKEKLLTLGQYPVMGLSDARVARDEAKAILREGRDPSIAKKQRKLSSVQQSGETFEVIARDWHKTNRSRWSEIHASDILRSLERDVFPAIGQYPVREVTVPNVLAALRPIEERDSKETARRIRQRMESVFAFAIASGKAEANPAATVSGAMAPVVRGRQPAVTDEVGALQIIPRVEMQPGHPLTKLAHRLLALTAVRPGVILGLPWAELPKGETLWTIPAKRMKLALQYKEDAARDHIVPLSRQAVEVIEAARTMSGLGPMVFPNYRNAHEPMTEGAMRHLLIKAGYKDRHVSHGWRSTFSSIMNERYPEDRQIIDLMLAHKPKDEVEGAYNRALHLKRRAELAQLWADFITKNLQPPANLLPAS